MSGGLVNSAECIPYTCTTAVTYAGTIVKGTTSASTVDICGAASTDITVNEPIGYTFTNTKDPITGVATAAKKVGICALIPGQVAEFVVVAANTQIDIGDKVMTAAAGTVNKKSGACWCVGTALEAVTGAAAGYVKVRINKHWCSA